MKKKQKQKTLVLLYTLRSLKSLRDSLRAPSHQLNSAHNDGAMARRLLKPGRRRPPLAVQCRVDAPITVVVVSVPLDYLIGPPHQPTRAQTASDQVAPVGRDEPLDASTRRAQQPGCGSCHGVRTAHPSPSRCTRRALVLRRVCRELQHDLARPLVHPLVSPVRRGALLVPPIFTAGSN
ncbi:hypothetical protein BC826DRAFT_320365 [Russula brevipes]|nr:hypothetical protein BC826DRAFT_320365 [Russula brevipes]